MKSPAQEIASAIDEAMSAYDSGRGISQSELSRRSGVPQATISRTLKGKTIPEVHTLSKLIDALGSNNVKIPKPVMALVAQPGNTQPVEEAPLDVLTVPMFPLLCPECGKTSHKSFIELEMNDRLPCGVCGVTFNINNQYGSGQLEMFLKGIGRAGFMLRKERKFD